jgi:hypothetical protein
MLACALRESEWTQPGRGEFGIRTRDLLRVIKQGDLFKSASCKRQANGAVFQSSENQTLAPCM